MLHGTVLGGGEERGRRERGVGSAQSQSLGLMPASKHNVVVLPGVWESLEREVGSVCERRLKNAADTLRKYSSLFISLILFTCVEKLCMSYR